MSSCLFVVFFSAAPLFPAYDGSIMKILLIMVAANDEERYRLGRGIFMKMIKTIK